MKIDGKTIGMELRALRIKKGLSVEEVCKNINIDRSTLYKCERDANKMRLGILEQLLNFYGIDTFIFFKMISEYMHMKEE